MSHVVTRIPPGPTGYFHVGRARTALFNYLFARHTNGKVMLRFEDTDKARSKKEFEQDIIDSLAWLGITYDNEPFRQSERTELYRSYIEKMLQNGSAYISHETEGTNTEVIRFKNPNKTITFTDLIRGEISFDTTELKDFIVARNINDPLYHLTVVVDDFETGVTHVIRGEDGISNTPRQILLQEAIGAPRPTYAHLPLILSPDKGKMSARHGATSLRDFKQQGFLPEAMVNYLALLGWSPGDDREYFSLSELVELFDIERIQKSGASWNQDKLLSINQYWMRKLSDEVFLVELIKTDLDDLPTRSDLVKAVPLLKERAQTFSEAREMLEGELKCLFETPSLDPSELSAKEPADRPGMTKIALEMALEALKSLPEGLSAEAAKDALMPLADSFGREGQEGATTAVGSSPDAPKGAFRGAFLWPLRYALSGQAKSPDPFTLISILGLAESAARVQKAIELLWVLNSHSLGCSMGGL